jgi:lysyl-tRNA synthetase, class II
MNRVIRGKSRTPRVISIFLILQSASIIGFFSAHRFPHFVQVVGKDLHSSITQTTDTAAVIIAVALALIARGIFSRRKRAWQLATVLQSALLLLGIFHTGSRLLFHHRAIHVVFGNVGITHLIFEILLLIALIVKRKDFNTLANPHTRKSDLFYFLQVTGLSYFVAVVIVYFERTRFVHHLSFLEVLQTALQGLIGVSGPVAFLALKSQERIENLLLALGLLIAITTLYRALRPIERIAKLSREDKSAMSELITRYPSEDSLAYFALRDDKDVIWAKNRKAAIAYSVINGTMLASGDPLGDPECWPAAIEEFILEADRHSWIPAVYGCTEKAGEIWRRETECDALEIGDEAIVLVNDFDIATPQLKSVRQMVNKARKEGYETHTKKISQLTSDERSALARYAQEWRRGGDERGFSMALGRFCDTQDPDAVISWAMVGGRYKALLQFVPWGSDGLSLDLMRRASDCVSGVNELLIAATIEYSKVHEVAKISLNFATFRSIFEKGERLGAGPITRFNHKVLIQVSRFVQMESLYRFNAKFQPVWEPRYILFPSIGHLGRVAIAILRVESFLPGRRQKNSHIKAE